MNQIVGFTMLGYPKDAQAYAWGIVIGAAAFVAFGAAKFAVGAEPKLVSARSVAAIVASIVAYQAVMFVGAAGLDGFASSTPEIVATVARNDLFWFAGLGALRIALGTAMPRWFGSALTPRPA